MAKTKSDFTTLSSAIRKDVEELKVLVERRERLSTQVADLDEKVAGLRETIAENKKQLNDLMSV